MSSAIPLLGNFTAAEQQQWLHQLHNLLPDEQIIPFEQLNPEQKQQAELAIVANPDPEHLAQLPNLLWVQSLWAGVEKILPLFSHSPTKLVRLIDPALAEAMSEAVLTWSLFLHRDMHRYQIQQQQQTWLAHQYRPAQQTRIGVLGLGELGLASARRLQQNQFQVTGWSRQPKEFAAMECLHGQQGLEQLLQSSDIIICLLPLTPQTQGLLNATTLRFCKPSACLVNFARGPIIDNQALLQSLDAGLLQHAVLDVFATEPLPADDPFWQHPQVTVLPHISAPTRQDTASQIVADNIRRYRALGELPATVDVSLGY